MTGNQPNLLNSVTMLESDFHAIADKWLLAAQDAIEDADDDGVIDVDCAQGVLTIGLGGQVFLVSKHAPSMQMWLSSPISGGLHFSYDEVSGQWVLKDGRSLVDILSNELQTLSGIHISF